jgi:hypothetical protein
MLMVEREAASGRFVLANRWRCTLRLGLGHGADGDRQAAGHGEHDGKLTGGALGGFV